MSTKGYPELLVMNSSTCIIFFQYFNNKLYVVDCYFLLLMGKNNNFNGRFKLKTHNNMSFRICCKICVYITFFY